MPPGTHKSNHIIRIPDIDEATFPVGPDPVVEVGVLPAVEVSVLAEPLCRTDETSSLRTVTQAYRLTVCPCAVHTPERAHADMRLGLVVTIFEIFRGRQCDHRAFQKATSSSQFSL